MIQLWEIPAEQLLRSSLATAPLAVLGKLPETLALTDGLASVVRQLAERLERDASGGQADRLLVAAYVLTGLRLKVPDEVRQLFQGVSISECADRLIALYDAEGIGGSGPVALERIAAQQLQDVGIYRVCGEDIREGALSIASTSIFPAAAVAGSAMACRPRAESGCANSSTQAVAIWASVPVRISQAVVWRTSCTRSR